MTQLNMFLCCYLWCNLLSHEFITIFPNWIHLMQFFRIFITFCIIITLSFDANYMTRILNFSFYILSLMQFDDHGTPSFHIFLHLLIPVLSFPRLNHDQHNLIHLQAQLWAANLTNETLGCFMFVTSKNQTKCLWNKMKFGKNGVHIWSVGC